MFGKAFGLQQVGLARFGVSVAVLEKRVEKSKAYGIGILEPSYAKPIACSGPTGGKVRSRNYFANLFSSRIPTERVDGWIDPR